MQKVKNLKQTIYLSPIQLIWLHSNRQFKDIQQSTRNGVNEIKFYKNNKGVQIRYQDASPTPDLNVIDKAKIAIESLINKNQIRLIEAELTKELYIKISRQVRKEFDNVYIVFLHYETFQNCCKKLKDKFNITSVEHQLEKLKNQNPNFCFLICEKEKMDEIYEYTHKLLNLDVSIASTTVTRKINKIDYSNGFAMGKRSLSVKSLKGSFTSGGDQLDQRFSLNNSQSDEQIYSMNNQIIQKLSKPMYDKIKNQSRYGGRKIVIDDYKYPQYVDCKRRLYYTNRLQHIRNPYVQRVYGYYTYQNPLTAQWKLSLICQAPFKSLRQEMKGLNTIHHWKRKFLLLYRLGKIIDSIHSNMQNQSELNPDKIYIDCQSRVLISGSTNKQIPPYTCSFQYDIRLYFCIIYWAMTGIEITYETIIKKLNSNNLMFTMISNTKTKPNLQFLNLVNRQFSKNIDLNRFLVELKMIMNKSN